MHFLTLRSSLRASFWVACAWRATVTFSHTSTVTVCLSACVTACERAGVAVIISSLSDWLTDSSVSERQGGSELHPVCSPDTLVCQNRGNLVLIALRHRDEATEDAKTRHLSSKASRLYCVSTHVVLRNADQNQSSATVYYTKQGWFIKVKHLISIVHLRHVYSVLLYSWFIEWLWPKIVLCLSSFKCTCCLYSWLCS